jgi:hypothetical protein
MCELRLPASARAPGSWGAAGIVRGRDGDSAHTCGALCRGRQRDHLCAARAARDTAAPAAPDRGVARGGLQQAGAKRRSHSAWSPMWRLRRAPRRRRRRLWAHGPRPCRSHACPEAAPGGRSGAGPRGCPGTFWLAAGSLPQAASPSASCASFGAVATSMPGERPIVSLRGVPAMRYRTAQDFAGRPDDELECADSAVGRLLALIGGLWAFHRKAGEDQPWGCPGLLGATKYACAAMFAHVEDSAGPIGV